MTKYGVWDFEFYWELGFGHWDLKTWRRIVIENTSQLCLITKRG